MDFIDPKKKKAHQRRLFIGYALMGIAILIASTILVYQANGFDVDRKTGTLIQNGLLFVDSHPVSANITLNGEDKGQTSARLVIPDGKYSLQLNREGYRQWSRDFLLEGSKIERMVYPFMFPTNIQSEDAQLYAQTPGFSSQSPDRKWVLVQQPGKLNSFDQFDLSQENVSATEVKVPEGLYTNLGTGTHTLELAEWSNDNRHMLIKHIYDGGFEFIMVDRANPNESINVNKTLNVNPTSITLRDKKFDQLYLLTAAGGILQLGDTRAKTVLPVLTDVITYKTYSTEEILFVTTKDAEAGKALVKIRTADKVYTLRDLPAKDPNYLVDISKFEGAWYMVAGASLEKKAYIYKDPFDTLNRSTNNVAVPETVLKLDTTAQYVSFSANVRFIALQGGPEFAVYDAEMDKLHRFNTKLELAPAEKARWMDGHRLTLNSGGKLTVFDYEGSNLQQLVAMNTGSLPYFDRDYNRLVTLSPSVEVTTKTALLLSYMRIPADR